MHYQTKQREKLMDFFKRNIHKRVSAKEIAESLKNEDISLSAVYRNLKLLEERGTILRFDQQGKKDRMYQYRDGEACQNRIHVTCLQCGDTFHLPGEFSDSVSEDLMSEANFFLDKGKTIIYGVCKNCL